MEHLGPGTTLGERYIAGRRLHQHPRWERWAAEDTVLGRDVVLLCFSPEDAQASATVDAGRRAAVVEDPRLVRVLDVVTSGPAYAVVEEAIPDAHALTQILAGGGLPGDEALRITGECAVALATAATRGLHHLVLTPSNVLIRPDGAIMVRGVATEGALFGQDDLPAGEASRRDARALVAIGYAALTGRWPLPGPNSGLQAAPTLSGRVVTPGDLGAGSSPELDRLSRVMLVENAGPQTPEELVAVLRPWSPVATIAVAIPLCHKAIHALNGQIDGGDGGPWA